MASEWVTPTPSGFPWHATSQHLHHRSPRIRTQAVATQAGDLLYAPSLRDFALQCELSPGTRACYPLSVRRRMAWPTASFPQHLALLQLPSASSSHHHTPRYSGGDSPTGDLFPGELTPLACAHAGRTLARHRIAAQLRLLLTLKGCGWAARGALSRSALQLNGGKPYGKPTMEHSRRDH